MSLTEVKAGYSDGDPDTILVAGWDHDRRVVGYMPVLAIEDRFGPRENIKGRRVTHFAEDNVRLLGDLVEAKYRAGRFRLFRRHAMTIHRVDITVDDLAALDLDTSALAS
jgi:hypothetical protein